MKIIIQIFLTIVLIFLSSYAMSEQAQVAPTQEPSSKGRATGSTFRSGEPENTSQYSRVRRQVVSIQPTQIKTQGQAADPTLKKTKAGVPYFRLYTKKKVISKKNKTKIIRIRVKEIPHLNVGVEREIAVNQFNLDKINIKKVSYDLEEKLPEAKENLKEKLKLWLKKKLTKAPELKQIKRKDDTLGIIVTQKAVDDVHWVITPNAPEKTLKKTDKLSKNELKMLQALSLYSEKNHCHLVSGLFADLAETKFKTESNYYLGLCAHEMGLKSEAVKRLLPIVKMESPLYTPKAIEALLKDLPREFEVEISKVLRNIKNTSLVPVAARDDLNYVAARGSYKVGDYSVAIDYASNVTKKSKHYYNAQYLKSVAQYIMGKAKTSIKTLENLRAQLNKDGKKDNHLLSLIAVNLGRMYFQRSQYKNAYQNYMEIHKGQSVWVEGLIEQGWTQVMLGDYAGVIGNMYSLHSPYFKSVYKPESLLVRTIGYINICQYGDAYRTLSQLEKRYSHWYSLVDTYLNQNKDESITYYKTVKAYLLGKSTKDVDGLPYQVIREAARQRNFLNNQETINEKLDEMAQYKFIHKLISKDKAEIRRKLRKARAHRDELKANLQRAKKEVALQKHIIPWTGQLRNEHKTIALHRFRLEVYEEGRQGFKRLIQRSSERIKKEENVLKLQAGHSLRTNIRNMHTDIKRMLDNNEFLRYEVFSGSGQNIRYQVAGGKTGKANRIPASVKPDKSLNWEFDGEYWEDEIGSYRSSLHNNCPKFKKRSEASANNWRNHESY